MHELKLLFDDEQMEQLKELACRYRSTPLNIAQCFINADVRSLEPCADTDEFFLDELQLLMQEHAHD